MNPTHRYAFNLPWRGAIVGAICWASLSFFAAHLARDLAGIIFIGLMALIALFAALSVFMMIRRLVFPRVLELTEAAVLFPRGFPRTRITRILYEEIIFLRDSALGSNVSFCMETSRGTFEIGSIRLPDIKSYDAVKNYIYSRASYKTPGNDEQAKIWAAFPEPFREPADWARYRTHLITSKPFLPRFCKVLWFSARCMGFFLLPWLLLYLFQLPTTSLCEFLGVCIPVTFFFTVLYWANLTNPTRCSEITVLPNGIKQLSGKQTCNWSYRDFSGWCVVERIFEGRVLYILLLKRPTLKRPAYVVAFALPDISTRDRFVQILQVKKIPQLPDLNPPWESTL